LNNYFKHTILLLILCFSCSKNEEIGNDGYIPTPATLTIPEVFQGRILPHVNPSNNPLTEEGIALGKRLFFDKKLSADNTQAYASWPGIMMINFSGMGEN